MDYNSTEDFTVLIPLFNSPKYFRNKEFTDTIRERVVLCVCVTNDELREFADQMEKEGYNVFRFNGSPKSPWHVFRSVLDAQLVLLREALPVVGTKYTIFLDGDSVPLDDFGKACRALERGDYGLGSVRVLPREKNSIIQKLQDVEYQIAMVSRRFRPWLTSGACIIGRTDILRIVMANHTTFFYGGDIEVGRIAKRLCKVCHLDLTVLTDVPSSFHGWVKQRAGWWAGSFRQSVINFDKDLRQSPVWSLYFFGVVWSLFAFRWTDIIVPGLRYNFWYVPLLLLPLYWPMNLLVAWRFKIRTRWVLAYPLYAIFQTLFLPPLGFVKYTHYAFKTKTLGRLRM